VAPISATPADHGRLAALLEFALENLALMLPDKI
jgi:hypothetical protein